MSVKHTGVWNSLQEQPGTKVNVNSAGLATIWTTYIVEAGSLFAQMPPVGSAHPRYAFAELDEVNSVLGEGDMYTLECIYKGRQPTAPINSGQVYQMVSSTSEVPLEGHERYKDVIDKDLATIRDVMDGKTKPDAAGLTGRAKELMQKMLRGQECYLRRSTVWRETTTAATGFSELSKVGKIDTPTGGAPSNSPGNWLLVSADQKKQGSTWELVREWMASGPEKWDEDIYGDTV